MKIGIVLLLFIALVNGRAVLWKAMDYHGLNVRSWEDGIEEAQRREMPLMVFFLESTKVDGAIRKIHEFTEDKAWMKRTSKFIVVTADDTDDIFTQTLGDYESVEQPYPKICFYHYNGNQFHVSNEHKNYVYEDSFDLTDVMEDVLDRFEDGYVPEKEEL